jgi:hypothetical protein
MVEDLPKDEGEVWHDITKLEWEGITYQESQALLFKSYYSILSRMSHGNAEKLARAFEKFRIWKILKDGNKT